MKSFIVLRKEFKRLNRSIIFFLGIILISIVPIILDGFVLKYNLQNSKYAAIQYFNESFLFGMYLIPLIIFVIYYYDKKSDILKIIYTNPISPFQYSVGKFLTAICFYLQCTLIGSIITIIFPIFYGKSIYSICTFLIVFLLFSLPLIIFFIALSNLVNIIFKQSIISIIIPLFIFFVLAKFPLFSSISRLNFSTDFINGNYKFVKTLILTDAIYISIAILCIIISTIIYCHQNNH
ncbi:ABC transporter permease (plasmid) [Haloimpatiens sp. FM7330]|uniref:ABC transporter permease n=1 Tax=Haloimpatiens sp. FM7330 TaxID=3298610 RepID=UPI0036273251